MTKNTDAYSWIGSSGGSWGLASDWQDVTSGQDPALSVPGSLNAVTITGPTGTVYEVIVGGGASASLGLTGYLDLVGAYTTGALTAGASGTANGLILGAGSSLSATAVNVASGSVSVSGAGASLSSSGAVAVGASVSSFANGSNGSSIGALSVGAGGALSVSGVLTVALGSLSVSGIGAQATLLDGLDLGHNIPSNPGSPAQYDYPSSGSLTVEGGATVLVTGAINAVASPIAVSGAGSDLTASGTLTLIADLYNLNSLSAAAGASVQIAGLVLEQSVYDASLGYSDSDNVFVDLTSTLEVGSAGAAATGALTVDAGHSISVTATAVLSANVVDNGVITETGGTLTISGKLSGSGQVQIGANSTLAMDGTAGIGNTVAFTGSNATLEIGSLGTYNYQTYPYVYTYSPYAITATLSGFATGDAITLDNTTVTSAVYTASGLNIGTLALFNGTTQVESLTLAGDYAGRRFLPAPTTGAGSAIVLLAGGGSGASPVATNTDAYSWIGSSGGSWGLASDWQDVTSGQDPALSVPGSLNAVTITGPTGTVYEVIVGGGASASLGLTGYLDLVGAYTTGALTAGASGTANGLILGAGSSLSATAVNVASGSVSVSGAGASLSSSGAVAVGASVSSFANGSNGSSSGALSVGAGGALSVSGVLTVALGSLSVSGIGAQATLLDGLDLGHNIPSNPGSPAQYDYPSSGSLTVGGGATVLVTGAINAVASPIAVSGAGSDLTASGTLTLIADLYNLNSLSAAAGASVQIAGLVLEQSVYDASLGYSDSDNVFVDLTSTLEVGSAGAAATGALTVDAGHSISVTATAVLSANVVDNGVITETGGTLTISGKLSGSGQVQIGANSTLAMDGTAGIGNTVAFTGSNATLEIGSLGTYNYQTYPYVYTYSPYAITATLSGFATGDAITLDNTTVTSAVYTASGLNIGTLALFNGTTQVESLTLAGDYAGRRFLPAPTTGAGSAIVLLAGGGSGASPVATNTDAYSWIGSSGGSWGLASDWQDVTSGQDPALSVPGSLNAVTITGPTGTVYEVIVGGGASASLGLTGYLDLVGAYTTGALTAGASGTANGLILGAGSSLSATAVNVASGSVSVSGAGASLSSSGAVAVGASVSSFANGSNGSSGALSVGAGGALSVSGVLTVALGSLSVSGIGAQATLLDGLDLGHNIPSNPGSPAQYDYPSSGSLTVGGGATVLVTGAINAVASPIAVSGAGSDLTASGTLTLIADLYNLNSLSAAAGASVQIAGLVLEQSVYDASLGYSDSDNVSVDLTSTLEVGSAGAAATGALTVDAGHSISVTATAVLSANVVDNGVITETGGTLTISGKLSGSGQVQIGANSTLAMDGTAGIGNTVAFTGSNATLEIGYNYQTYPYTYSPYAITATLSGFATGDAITLDNTTVTSAVYTASGLNIGTLALFNGTTQVESLTLAGDYAGRRFLPAPTTGAGSAIVLLARPVAMTPTAEIVSLSKSTLLAGISVVDTNVQATTVTVTLTDSHGLLSANAVTGGTITGSGSTSLTVTGTVAQVDADLATLSFLSNTPGQDALTLSVVDSLGSKAIQSLIQVSVVPQLAGTLLLTRFGEGATIAAFQTLADFSDNDPAAKAGDFTATIAWGDGTTTQGVVAGSNGAFTVTPDSVGHAYTTEGMLPLAVTLAGAYGSRLALTGNVDVADVLTPGATIAASPAHGVPFTDAVANFKDSYTGNNAADFTATIDWGDGSASSPGVVTYNAGAIAVSGNHTYTVRAGTKENVVVSISDAGGAAAAVTTTATVGPDITKTTLLGPLATEGVPFTGSVASFIDADTTDSASMFTAVITWGDGSKTDNVGLVTGGNGAFVVSTIGDGHIYHEPSTAANYNVPASDPFSVTLSGFGGWSLNLKGANAVVLDANILSPGTNPDVYGRQGVATNLVANFNDSYTGANFSSDPTKPVQDFHATINWGDLTTSTGMVSYKNGKITVSGSHTYSALGTDIISVSLSDKPGSASTFTDIVAHIQKPAIAEYELISSPGRSWSHSGNTYTLDLGQVEQGPAILESVFDLFNGAVYPADTLSGNFSLLGDGTFSVNGTQSFAGLSTGDYLSEQIIVDADTSTLGAHTKTITLMPSSDNPTSSVALEPVTLIVTDYVGPYPVASSFPSGGGGGYDNPPPSPLPPIPPPLVANGDPHLITYDKNTYDLQAVGEFILTKNAAFEVQIRTAPLGQSTVASVIIGVAVSVGAHRVTLEAGVLMLDGSAFSLGAGPVDLGAGRLSDVGGEYEVTYNTGEVVEFGADGTADTSGSYAISIALGPNDGGTTVGLLGNDDGNALNDFKLADGTQLKSPMSQTQLYQQFAAAWRVADSNSLFDYGAGQSTATYTDLNFPTAPVSIENLPPQLVAEGRALAAKAGITDPLLVYDAVYDYAVSGGDLEYITQAKNISTKPPVGPTVSGVVPADPTTAPPLVSIQGPAATIIDSPAGTPIGFQVSRTGDSTAALTLSYAVVAPSRNSVTAVNFGGVLPTGSVTIAAGAQTANLTVVLTGSLGSTPSEQLTVQIATTGSTTVVDVPTATATIGNEQPVAGADADPTFVLTSGFGTLTRLGNAWSLNLSTVTQGQSEVPIGLAIANLAQAGANTLSGSFDTAGSGYSVTGTSPLPDIEAGAQNDGLYVVLQTDTFGAYTEQITLHPTSDNASGYSGTLADQVLTITDTINAPPVFSLPSDVVSAYQNAAVTIPGIDVGDADAMTADETIMVELKDSNGLLSASTASLGGGGTITGTGTDDLIVTGTLGQVQADLTTVTYVSSTLGTDFVNLTATDSRGGDAVAGIVTVKTLPSIASPVVTAPKAVTIMQGVSSTIPGISLAEPGNLPGETFTVSLTDTEGLLSATGAGVSGDNTTELTISGSLAEVNTDLETLSDTSSALASDSIVVHASDSFGNTAVAQAIAVTVLPALTITGTQAQQGISDQATIAPFAHVTIAETGSVTETAKATVSATADGTLSDLGAGSYDPATGVYTVSGSPSAVTTALDGLVFTPTPFQAAPGAKVTTGFELSVRSSSGATATDDTTSVVATAAAVWDIAAGARLEITGSSHGQTVDFLGRTGLLVLDQPALADLTVTGFVSGDHIELAGVDASTAAPVLTDATLSIGTLKLGFSGDYTGEAFSLVTAADGDAELIVASISMLGGHGRTLRLGSADGNVVVSGYSNSLTGTGSSDDLVQVGGQNNVVTLGDGNNAVTTLAGSKVSYLTLGDGANQVNLGGTLNTVLLGNGADSVTMSGSNNSVTAGNGLDSVTGGTDNESVLLGNGDDTVEIGGFGNSVTVGDGNDTVDGGAGTATIDLGKGDDSVTLNGRNNTVTGGDGNDSVIGGRLADTVTLGNGNDTVQLGGLLNVISLGDGRNTISAGSGQDSVKAGGGSNSITLAGSDNVVVAGNGDDTVAGTGGNANSITLGDGADSVQVDGNLNTIRLGNGGDSVSLTGLGNTVIAGDGGDTVTGGADNNTVMVGTGTYTVSLGGWGNSVTVGGGTSTVDAGLGTSTIRVDAGNVGLTLHGRGDMVFLHNAAQVSITDHSAGLSLGIDSGDVVAAINGFGATSGAMVDLAGAGFSSVAQVMVGLQSDGHGGSMLALGGTGSLDFSHLAPASLHANNFSIT